MDERISWIDVARGIAILLVVGGHSIHISSAVSGHEVYALANRAIYSFHMPFFFLLSGYLFGRRNQMARPLSALLVTNVKRLVLPYWGTCFAVLACLYALDLIVGDFMDLDCNGAWLIIVNFMYGSGKSVRQFAEFTGAHCPWFLLCLCAANIVFWLIIKRIGKWNAVVQLGIILGVSYAGSYIGKYIFLPWSLDVALAAQIFVFAGYRINALQQSAAYPLKVHLGILGGCLCIWIIDIGMGGIGLNDRVYNYFIVSAAGGIAGSILLLYVSFILVNHSLIAGVKAPAMVLLPLRLINLVLSYLGREALMIYCWHVMDITYFRAIYSRWVFFGFFLDNVVVIALFRLFFSMAIIRLIRFIPGVRRLFYWKEYAVAAG